MLYSVFFVMIFILITLLLTEVKVSIRYIKDNQVTKSKADIIISVFKDLLNFKINQKLFDKIEPIDVKEIHIDSIKSKIFQLLDIYKKNLGILIDHQNYLNSKITIRKYALNIEYGTGDAAVSGLLYGVAWSFVSIIEAVVFCNKIISCRDVTIKVNFNEKCLNVRFHCIFSVKFVHIIMVGFRSLKSHLKMKFISKGGNVVG